MAATQVPPKQLEGTAPPCLRRRMVANHYRGDLVRPRDGADDPLLIPGHEDSLPVAQHGLTEHHQRDSWSARCSGTGTAGAEGGSEKRTGREASTALRGDPTCWASRALCRKQN